MPTTRPPFARWVLLVAVIAGVFGMHVLTAGDGPGHGMVPVAMASEHHSPAVAAMAEPALPGPSIGGAPSGSGHPDMAGCILFLVGGAVLLLLALARLDTSNAESDGRAGRRPLDLRRRGPPGRWPRIALNVIRV